MYRLSYDNFLFLVCNLVFDMQCQCFCGEIASFVCAQRNLNEIVASVSLLQGAALDSMNGIKTGFFESAILLISDLLFQKLFVVLNRRKALYTLI